MKEITYDEISPITGNKCVVVEANEKTNIQSYLCIESGYATTDVMTQDSKQAKEYESKLSDLMRNSKYEDKERQLIWYPAFMRMANAMLYCIGESAENLKWQVAKIVLIEGEDRLKYPVLGKENEYHTSRLDVENAKTYDKMQFKSALDEFYLIIKEAYDNENKLRNNSL